MPDQAYADELCALGMAAGLARVGIASAEPFTDVQLVLEQRRDAGLHGGMQFTYRNPARSTDPARALAGVRSLVVGARAHPVAQPPAPEGGAPVGRVARYAAEDHYAALRQALDRVAGRLRADGWRAVVLADDNALVDRAAAHRAGLGWYGKNSNLLLEGSGSWFVLGSVLTDADLPPAAEPVADGCGACTRCLDGCPTGAIVAPGVVDARRCLAWLLQAEGDFPEEYRVALGDRLYGCDECQEVCPPSRRSASVEPRPAAPAEPGVPAQPRAPVEPAQRGVRADQVAPHGHVGAWVDLVDLLAASDDELLARFGRWYIPRRDPRYLRRNALVVLGNSGPRPTPDAVAALERYLDHDDDLLRRHARWAAARLGLAGTPQ